MKWTLFAICLVSLIGGTVLGIGQLQLLRVTTRPQQQCPDEQWQWRIGGFVATFDSFAAPDWELIGTMDSIGCKQLRVYRRQVFSTGGFMIIR